MCWRWSQPRGAKETLRDVSRSILVSFKKIMFFFCLNCSHTKALQFHQSVF